MSTQVQFRRGTTTQNNAFTGAAGEISVDTDLKTIRLHDGTTAGGGATMLNNISSQTALNKTFSTGSAWQGNAVGLAYGGTGSSLTATAGAVAYSGASGLALSAAGTSGQILTSGGSGAPTWVAASSISAGTSTLATTATNIAGGSAGQLVIQSDTNLSTFITAGAAGTFLQSAGAGYAPTWAAGQVTLGSTAVALGSTVTSFSGIANIIMSNGSYGGGTITGLGISGTGPWTVTVTGMSSTAGLGVGQNITANAGTGALFNGTPTSVVIASIVSSTSITVTVTGGTTPTAGTITNITVLGYLQVPVGTTAQRSWAPAVGMIRYNSDQVSFEGYSSGAWSSLGGVSSVNKYTYIRAETSAGAANGDLDFFAQNAGGNAAQQVGQWNRTNLKDYTGTLVGTQTTQSVFDTTATTVNAFGAATTLTLGNATSATLTLRPGTVVGSNTTQTLWNTTATTVNFAGAATAIALGASSGTLTIGNQTVVGVNTTQNLWNTGATTVNFAGAATTLNIGNSSGSTTLSGNLTVTGNITIQGSTETVTSANTTYSDSLLELHYTNGGTLTSDDGKDIGLRMHYYKGSDKNAALVLGNDSSQMEFYVNGTESSGVFSGTYGYYKGAGFNFKDIFTEESFTGTTSSTTPTAIYTFPTATWRSAELTIQVTNGTAYRLAKLMVIHDGTNVTLSENYLVGLDIQTGATATAFTASIATGVLTVYATAASGTSVVKGKSTLIRV